MQKIKKADGNGEKSQVGGYDEKSTCAGRTQRDGDGAGFCVWEEVKQSSKGSTPAGFSKEIAKDVRIGVICDARHNRPRPQPILETKVIPHRAAGIALRNGGCIIPPSNAHRSSHRARHPIAAHHIVKVILYLYCII